jgi:ABC-type uncharacterized transport system permease subunit
MNRTTAGPSSSASAADRVGATESLFAQAGNRLLQQNLPQTDVTQSIRLFGARSRTEIPGLSKIKPYLLGDIPVFGTAVFEQVWLFYAGIVIIAVTALVLRYTSIGLGHPCGRR